MKITYTKSKKENVETGIKVTSITIERLRKTNNFENVRLSLSADVREAEGSFEECLLLLDNALQSNIEKLRARTKGLSSQDEQDDYEIDDLPF